MKVFAISDLHLANNMNKPMDIFGKVWDNYWEDITTDWNRKVSEEDIVLLSGDISWAMKLEDAISDIEDIGKLKGHKIIIRGNHDYWWSSYNKVKNMVNQTYRIHFLQNNAVKIGDYVICGSRGWGQAEPDEKLKEADKKILDREFIRFKFALEDAARLRLNGEKLIVLSHFPPFDSSLTDNIFTDIFQSFCVDAVVYGHLHGRVPKADLTVTKNGIRYFLTSCDRVNNSLVQIF